MIPELGHFALILALVLAIIQTVVPFIGAQWRITSFMAAAGLLSMPAALIMLVGAGLGMFWQPIP